MTVHNPFNNLDYNQVHNGTTFGVGLEYAVNRNWSVDGRYAYINSPKKAYDFGGGPAYYGENSHNLMLGVNYRFR